MLRSDKEKERKKGTLKTPREKNTTMQKGTKLGIIADFPLEIIYTKRKESSINKVLGGKVSTSSESQSSL